MNAQIVVLPGDGIGPEVASAAQRVLTEVGSRFGHQFSFDERLIGGAAIDATGSALPDETADACRASDAVLLGAVGGPKWDDPHAPVRPEQGLLGLRKALGVYANLRPVRVHPSLVASSPLRPEILADVDLLVVRELTGGLYFGSPKGVSEVDGVRVGVDTLRYDADEIARIVRLACQIARGRRRHVTSVDKANVLASSRLWRTVATEVGAEFPDVTLEHQLVDSGAMRLIDRPSGFDVIVTGNMFGDILTDEAAVLTGSLGMLPSASLGDSGPGLYEPIHGSAPDIAGQGVANPLGTIASVAMLLRHSLGLEAEAAAIEAAIDGAVTDGARTRDLGGDLGTQAMTDAVLERLGGAADTRVS